MRSSFESNASKTVPDTVAVDRVKDIRYIIGTVKTETDSMCRVSYELIFITKFCGESPPIIIIAILSFMEPSIIFTIF
jgi:hypothetical protein